MHFSLLLVASMAANILASPLASPADQQLEKPQQCGLALCMASEVCCNPTCSMCTKPGMACTQQDCGHLNPDYQAPVLTTTARPGLITRTVTNVPTFPTTLMPLPYPGDGSDLATCGKNKCDKGHYCCNRSCGICVPTGGSCIQLYCKDGKLPGSN